MGGFSKLTSEVWREAGIPCAVLEGEFKQRQVGDWSCYLWVLLLLWIWVPFLELKAVSGRDWLLQL